MSDKPALIGVDWGGSNLRVMQIAEGGAVLAHRSDPRGAAGLAPADFPTVLREVASDWLGEVPVLVCGMAGARGRWLEVDYVPCPASAQDIAAGLARPDGLEGVAIVPGVALHIDGQLLDVMRGEETQALGLGDGDRLIVAPGTHSKWIAVIGGRIAHFRTFMTGELFAAVRSATMLGAGMGEPGRDPDAFRRGVERGVIDRDLAAALFSVRVEGLAGRLAPEGAADYLSGLLIGAEIGVQQEIEVFGGVTIVGAPALAARYAEVLAMGEQDGVEVVDVQTVTAAGLWRIWEASQ